MYFAAIDTESLNNPLIVNGFDQIKVIIDHEQNSKASEYHHVFIIRIADKNLDQVLAKIRKLLKKGWYSLYWKGNIVLVQYKDKFFKLSLKDLSTHIEALKYGQAQEIEREFLNFRKYISRYKKFISN